MMPDREKVIKGLEDIQKHLDTGYSFAIPWKSELIRDALAMLKELENEYENGFNDAMLGKQELMYEGTDGKWHKKDW